MKKNTINKYNDISKTKNFLEMKLLVNKKGVQMNNFNNFLFIHLY